MARRRARIERARRRIRRKPIWVKACQIGLLAVAGTVAFSVGCKIVRPFHLWLGESRDIRQMQAHLDDLDRRNAELRLKKVYLQRPEGAQNEARRLGYVDPGERTVILTPQKPKLVPDHK